MSQSAKLSRSVLYMPGSNQRALEKARSLKADVFIMDLEDAVAPEAKLQARDQVAQTVSEGGFKDAQVVVRINALDTEWGKSDARALAGIGADAILLPKVESRAELDELRSILIAADGPEDQALWMMAETPRGILDLDNICSAEGLEAIVLGTSDLSKELRVPAVFPRTGLLHALSHCVLIARAHGLTVLDGVHPGIDADSDFLAVCQQGRDLGFDGKTLIHPRQIDSANQTFGISDAEAEHAEALLSAWQEARDAGEGIAVLNGQLIEQLHIDEANRVLALHHAASR